MMHWLDRLNLKRIQSTSTSVNLAARGSMGVSGTLAREVTVSEDASTQADERSLGKFVGILAQLAVLLLVIDRFQIENEAFLRLVVLTVTGFSIHYFLPLRHRLPFFVFLSLAGIGLVLGLKQGAWLVGLGLAVIGICHLPIHFLARIGILLAAGGLLALPRWGLGQVPWSPAIWPLLGSMFVFRLIIYFYDRRHQAGPSRISQTLAYFFLLPNVSFPLFPVIDFKKFCRNYYDDDRHRIYQVGVEWMWRGLIQLILYRFVYYHLALDPLEVEDLGDLIVYMLSAFLLYVRISGHFHFVVGMLHLFGFNLPETHHRYFLASSFTDFWRRINIYWKDFVMKVVYYPVFFRLRRWGDTRALVLATVLTFVATWFLHMVQWFWIRGSVFVELNDIIFWSVFALLVLVNSIYETKRGRARTLTRRDRTLRESVNLVLRTVGTFAVICVLWSLWTSESVSDWLLLCTTAFKLPPWSAAQFAALAGALGLAVAIAVYGVWRGWELRQQLMPQRLSPAIVITSSICLFLVTVPLLTRPGIISEVLNSLRATELNRRDGARFQRGYYENLLAVGKFNDELWRVYNKFPDDFVRSLPKLGLARSTGDEQDYELVPLKEGRFAGGMMHTNRWGMRDKDYSQARPRGSYRMALLGSSHPMGSGVEDHETFEFLIEQRLNRVNGNGSGTRYEILNFAVAGYTPLHRLYQLEKKVFSFEPNMVLYIGHSSDVDSAGSQWIRMVSKGIGSQDGYLQELAQRTGIRPDMGPTESMRRIKPHARELLAWVYKTIVSECRKRHVHPVFVYLPVVTEGTEMWRGGDRTVVIDLAREAGFIVLDLNGVYNGYEPPSLWIMENDNHPNALGHQLIAERLYAELLRKNDELDLGLLQ